jgi:hypothetical protein
MIRRLDWPDRLAAALEAACHDAWTPERHCALWAADVVLAMTDVDLAAPYRGLAVSDAYRAMREVGHESIADALAAELEQVPLAFARRGDVVLRADGAAIGVCTGERAAYLTDAGGLEYLPTLEQLAAYRVG